MRCDAMRRDATGCDSAADGDATKAGDLDVGEADGDATEGRRRGALALHVGGEADGLREGRGVLRRAEEATLERGR